MRNLLAAAANSKQLRARLLVASIWLQQIAGGGEELPLTAGSWRRQGAGRDEEPAATRSWHPGGKEVAAARIRRRRGAGVGEGVTSFRSWRRPRSCRGGEELVTLKSWRL